MLAFSSDTGLTTGMPTSVHLRTQFPFSIVSRFMLERDLKSQCWYKLTLTRPECQERIISRYQLQGYYAVCQGQLLYKHFKPALLLRTANFLHLGCSKL